MKKNSKNFLILWKSTDLRIAEVEDRREGLFVLQGLH